MRDYKSQGLDLLPTALVETLLILLALTMAAASLGIALVGAPGFSRVLPFSGGILIGVAAFWVYPEIAAQYGWLVALCGIVTGFSLLWLVNRYVYAVCPACSHNHDHAACPQRLHGFSAPLFAAASLHSFFDGWSLGIAQQSSHSIRLAFLAGIGIHKIPEGIALGVLFLAATGSVWKASLSCAAVQTCMVLGGLLAVFAAPYIGPNWIGALLSIAAGVFVYLGYHAIESDYRARGMFKALMPALTGALGAAVLRLVPGL